jgi:4-hydroxybenzoate polyprenyltransferase
VSIRDWLSLIRINQWTKNVVVLAAMVFAAGDMGIGRVVTPANVLLVASAFASFCLVASGIYITNDLFDLESDRCHPAKRFRPLAAGRIGRGPAGAAGVVFIAAGMVLARHASAPLAVVVTAYAAIQILYTTFLKRFALVDVVVIAAGFVLRAVAGAVAISVHISPWLLLCAFILAMFLALCKRRHEKRLLADSGAEHRVSLDGYDERLLDQLIAVTAGATIVCYSIYTLWPDTVHKFGSAAMGFTIPFVVFGVFRYMDLVYRKDEGGRPEKVLLSDGPLLVDLALYALAVVAVFFFGR